MKTINDFFGIKQICILGLILSLQVIAPVIKSQTIEVDGGIGYTAVNYETCLGYEPYDWNNFGGYANVHVFLRINNFLSLGMGGGFQHFYSYEVRHEFYYGGYYYTKNIHDGTRLTALARFNSNNVFLDLGPGLISSSNYSGDLSPAIVASIGYAFKLPGKLTGKSKFSDKITIPIKITGSIVFEKNYYPGTDAVYVPFTIGAGISYKIK